MSFNKLTNNPAQNQETSPRLHQRNTTDSQQITPNLGRLSLKRIFHHQNSTLDLYKAINPSFCK